MFNVLFKALNKQKLIQHLLKIAMISFIVPAHLMNLYLFFLFILFLFFHHQHQHQTNWENVHTTATLSTFLWFNQMEKIIQSEFKL